MKTAIDKNETYISKLKRESLEWLERYGKNAPAFIFIAVNAFDPSREVPIRQYPETPFSTAYKEKPDTSQVEDNESKSANWRRDNIHGKERTEKVFDFVVRHKTDCYRAFKRSISHEGFKYSEGAELVKMAREEIGYSDKTWAGDIYNVLHNVYKSIVVDGVEEPSQVEGMAAEELQLREELIKFMRNYSDEFELDFATEYTHIILTSISRINHRTDNINK